MLLDPRKSWQNHSGSFKSQVGTGKKKNIHLNEWDTYVPYMSSIYMVKWSSRVPKTVNEGRKSSFKKQCWEVWFSTQEKWSENLILHHIQKINLKGIKDLDVRSKTIKLLQENIEESVRDTGVGDVLAPIPKAQATKPKSTNRTHHTLTTSVYQKNTTKRMNRPPMKREKIPVNHVFLHVKYHVNHDKELASRIYNGFL